MSGEREESHGMLGWVMLSITLWGGLLALGAFLFDASSGEIRLAPSFGRGAIVVGCVAAFLGGWALLLCRRRSV